MGDAPNGRGTRSTASGGELGRKLLSTSEVAEYLGVPIGTLYRWNYFGTGPRPIKVGRHLRYRERDVESWLEDQARG